MILLGETLPLGTLIVLCFNDPDKDIVLHNHENMMIGIDPSFDIPLSGELRTLIGEAAAIRGKSVSDFVFETLEETSRCVVQEHGTTILSDRDRDIFLAMLDADPEPNEALKQSALLFGGEELSSPPDTQTEKKEP